MTEHFTREEAVALAKAAGFDVRRGLGLRESVSEDVFARGLINEEVTALCNAAVTAKLKGWDAQGDKAYKRGFSDGMKEAPTGESWIRAIDEAMVGAHIGVAEMADDYGTAKKKLNALICWSVQVDRDLSRTQATPALKATIAQPEQASGAHTFGTKRRGPLEGWIGHHTPPANGQQVETLFCWGYENWAIHLGTAQYKELVRGRGGFYGAETGRPQDAPSYWRPLEGEEAPAVGAPDACVWTPDTDYETDVHYSACGEAWSFIEGGPKENKVRFCQGCGKPVKLTYQPKIGGV